MITRRVFTWFIISAVPFLNLMAQDSLEIKIMDCLELVGRGKGIDFLRELDKFESYLLTNSYLRDRSGTSYFAIYQGILDEGDISIKRDYSTKSKLDSISSSGFGSCYYKFRDTDLYASSKSKYKQLVYEIENTEPPTTDDFDPYMFSIKLYLRILEPSDLENPIFKYNALYSFYKLANDIN